MTKGDDPLVEALLDAERRKLDALCQRLGIDVKQPEPLRWMLIGQTLARQQPEFTGKRTGKGRPKKSEFYSIDCERAKQVEDFRSIVAENGHRLTATKAIEILRGKVPLFPSETELRALSNSVSRGNAVLRKIRSLVPR